MSVVSELARLIRLGFPDEVAQRIASGELDMSAEARMARAREQGYDVDTPDPDYKGPNILGQYALPAGSTALMASLLAAPQDAMAAALASGGGTAAATPGVLDSIKEGAMEFGGDLLATGEGVLSALEVPQRGIQGLLRAGYGLTQGEGFEDSMLAGADVVRQGVEASAKQAGDAVLEKTGNPELATMAYLAAILGSPI